MAEPTKLYECTTIADLLDIPIEQHDEMLKVLGEWLAWRTNNNDGITVFRYRTWEEPKHEERN